MKKSSAMILKKFPFFERHLNDYASTILTDNALSNYNEVEQTFLRLLWFFENPEKENFNLESLYKNLSDEWLSFALESIFVFFKEDTYLIKNPSFSLVTEKSAYYNQSDFVRFLNENKHLHELNFSRPMFNSYLKRGHIPEPDLVVGGSKYWTKGSCEKYLHRVSHGYLEQSKGTT